MHQNSELPVMAEMVVERFKAEHASIVTAESCTGGMIASLITSVAGASDVFDRGFVTYSNESKAQSIGVSLEILASFGAVSMETAIEMATGALEHSNASTSVSVTGIAGPGGGSNEKPVGLVFIAVANKYEEGAFGEEFRFGALGRQEIREEAAKMALEMLMAYGLSSEEN